MFERAYLDHWRSQRARLWCRVLGHRWQWKLTSDVCERCRKSSCLPSGGTRFVSEEEDVMSAIIPDPLHPNQVIVGAAAEPVFGVVTGASVLTQVHSPQMCEGRGCSVHHPSAHSMVTWKMLWRGDRGFFERTCPAHGVGHPDPDDVAYWASQGDTSVGVHGCCGCCAGRSDG